MKKRIALLTACLLAACTLLAQSDNGLALKTGTLAPFAEAEEAIVSIDLTQSEFGKENLYADYAETARKELSPKVLRRAIDDFSVQFNYQNKGGLQVVTSAADSRYRMDICLSRLNIGNAGGILDLDDSTAGGAKISGLIKLTDQSSGETLCTLEFLDISSDSKLSKKARIAGAFEDLGYRLGKMLQSLRNPGQ